MKRSILLYSLMIDFVIIISIIFLIFNTTGYTFGYMIQSGDLRLHLNKDYIGNQFTSLYSTKFSNNNYVFLSFLPLFNFFEFLGYDFSILYIYFGILILIYLVSKYSLIVVSESQSSKTNILLISSLCFFLAINPSSFNRLGHFTILHSFIFFPLIISFLYFFLRTKSIIYLFLLFLAFFFGNSVPNSVVVNASTLVVFPILYALFFRERLSNFLKSYFSIILVQVISLLHIIFPVFIGMGQHRSIFESDTSSYILSSLSRNSNFLTSVSGTNYYYDLLIRYPFQAGFGFLILIFGLTICFLTVRKLNKLSEISLFFFLVYLIIVGGYNTYPWIFEFLLNLPLISDFLWVIKDPNMYYQYFFFFIILIISLQVSYINKKNLIIFFSIFLLIGNFFFNYFSETEKYRSFFQFIPKPSEYNDFVEILKTTEYRNLWVPYNTYNSKIYSYNIPYFPSPALWVTENKELTNYTQEYAGLISILENEIYGNKCENKRFISWLIKTNSLNIVVDKMTKNYPQVHQDNSESKVSFFSECLKSIDSLELFYTSENIDSYISKLSINSNTYKLVGNMDYLVSFIESSPANIIYEAVEESDSFSVEKIEESLFILQESYDKNWLDSQGNPPRYRINLVNMAFNSPPKEYRGLTFHLYIVYFQYLLVSISLICVIYFILRNTNVPKYFKT